MLTRRRFLGSAAAAAGLAACASHPKLTRPNILFLMPDQFRGMDLGVMGNPDVRTPNMDRLANEGVLLRNTYANCPVCCPARGTLLTGKYAHHHGVDVNDAPLPNEEVSIAEILGEQGYRTGFVGKWHLEGGKRQPGYVPPGPRRQGFQFWAANICSHDYWNMHYFRDSPTPIPMPDYSAKTFTDEAINFLKEESDQPFLLYVQWGPPHNPYVAPPEYMNLYDPDALTMRENWETEDPNDSRRDIAGYYAAITFIDDEVGRLMRVLEENGQAENTIVVITSDHGDMLASHGMRRKRKPFEESIRVPGIVSYPAGGAKGRVVEEVISHVDLVPTMLGLARAEQPEGLDGKDLSALIFSEEQGGASDAVETDSVYLQSYTPSTEGAFEPVLDPDPEFPSWRGVRTERYTYARSEQSAWALFDNQEDPFQLNNLVGKPEHSELQAELDQKTMEWFAETGDEWVERYDVRYREA